MADATWALTPGERGNSEITYLSLTLSDKSLGVFDYFSFLLWVMIPFILLIPEGEISLPECLVLKGEEQDGQIFLLPNLFSLSALMKEWHANMVLPGPDQKVCKGPRSPFVIFLVDRKMSGQSPRIRLKGLGFAGRVM